MKILKTILLIALPILITLNLFSMSKGNDTFIGFSYLFNYLNSFNAFENTKIMLSNFNNVFANVNLFSSGNVFTDLWQTIVFIGQCIAIPFQLLFSFLSDVFIFITWILGIFGNYFIS